MEIAAPWCTSMSGSVCVCIRDEGRDACGLHLHESAGASTCAAYLLHHSSTYRPPPFFRTGFKMKSNKQLFSY